MAKGHPDWQPVAAGVGREQASVTSAVVPYDLFASPGAGFRRLCFWFHVSQDAAAGAIFIDEVTAANVFVRRLWRGNVLLNDTVFVPFDGLPLGADNHARVTAAPGQTTVGAIFGTIAT